jgi:His-Xaa-Ser system protein HxsD
MDESVRVQRSDGAVAFFVDESIYSRAAIIRASHWYSGKYFVSTSSDKSGTFVVKLRPRNGSADFEKLENEFESVLLDSQLRTEIREETCRIRELIVAKAFAEGDLLDDPPVGDWLDPVAQKNKNEGTC